MESDILDCNPSKRKITKSISLRVLCLFVVASAGALMLGCGSAINTPEVHGAVAGTTNPLVAQYTVASGCAGQAMVEFGPDTSYGRSTNWVPVAGMYKRTTILVAGMRASTTYHLRSQIQCSSGSMTATTADTTFTTGPLPPLPLPAMSVSRPMPSQT